MQNAWAPASLWVEIGAYGYAARNLVQDDEIASRNLKEKIRLH